MRNNSKNKKNMRTNRERNKYRNKEEKSWCGSLPRCAENTIRSKIEDKLTDRGRAENANTPWAPSGPERIEAACGKVPLQAR